MLSSFTGWCLTPTLLLICSSFSRENGHIFLICSSLSTAQFIFLPLETSVASTNLEIFPTYQSGKRPNLRKLSHTQPTCFPQNQAGQFKMESLFHGKIQKKYLD